MKPSVLKLLVALALLAPLTLGTSPVRVYHQYHVSGRISRPAGGSLVNHATALAARYYRTAELALLRGMSVAGDRVVSLTDSAGNFHLVASIDVKLDSLAVAIVAPERPVFYGEMFGTDSAQVFAQTATSKEPGVGCGGCDVVSTGTRTAVVGYTYFLRDRIVAVPW